MLESLRKARHQILYLIKQLKYDTSIHPVPLPHVGVHGNALVMRQLLRHSSVHVSAQILLGVFVSVFQTAKIRVLS
jgi:hypothetical protein